MGTMEIIACLWIILALSTMAFSQPNFYTHGRYGKRGESHGSNTQPLSTKSRYGHGSLASIGISTSTNEKSSDKTFGILPRVDRFFPGSRYGKRGSMDKHLDNNDELTKVNIQNLKAVLSYIYRVPCDDDQRLIGNEWNDQGRTRNDRSERSHGQIDGHHMSQDELKSNNKWRLI